MRNRKASCTRRQRPEFYPLGLLPWSTAELGWTLGQKEMDISQWRRDLSSYGRCNGPPSEQKLREGASIKPQWSPLRTAHRAGEEERFLVSLPWKLIVIIYLTLARQL
ncbi:hypothetical protein TNCV_2457211 [Trichonephila clavipes]|nr:hypothetical protein TNCV_2457211 [Trichonephila clavipes]